MRKYIITIVLLLLFFSSAVADRIYPTVQIGLFIDPNLFDKCIANSELDRYIYDQDTSVHDWSPNIFKSYWFNDGSFMINIVDQHSKISSISLTFGPELSLDSNFVKFVLRNVLNCSGLLFTNTDQVIGTFVSEEEYLNETFGIFYSRDFETGAMDVDIYSWYWFALYKIDPFSRMKYYSGCDTNYIGACVPNVNYDLDRSDVGVRNFFVIGQDKHNFDGDKNGVCCEPYPIF